MYDGIVQWIPSQQPRPYIRAKLSVSEVVLACTIKVW